MAFTRKRGRPRSQRPQVDMGTTELQQKRMLGITEEPIDICLKKGLVNEAQHQAARRRAWLYRLRHGKTWVSALEWDDSTFGHAQTDRDDDWQAAREDDLQVALALLEQHRLRKPILDICVYHYAPSFLKPQSQLSLSIAESHNTHYTQLCDGLTLLSQHWRQSGTQKQAAPS